MDENRVFIYDTGIGYGGETICYDKRKKHFYATEYMWHLDDSQELLGERILAVDTVIDIIRRSALPGSAAALRSVSELAGIDCSEAIAEFGMVNDEDKRRKYWTDLGPRSDSRKHEFASLTVHPVKLYKVNEHWLPDLKFERSILKNQEKSAHPHKEAVGQLRDLLQEKEREQWSLPVEGTVSQKGKAGHTTQYFRDNDCNFLYRKILLSPKEEIWLKIYYSFDYYFRQYGIEAGGKEYIFDVHGETKLRQKLGLTDSRQPLPTALIEYLNRKGMKTLTELLSSSAGTDPPKSAGGHLE